MGKAQNPQASLGKIKTLLKFPFVEKPFYSQKSTLVNKIQSRNIFN